MRYFYLVLSLLTLLFSQSSFAHGIAKENGPCGTIAKACKAAGFSETDAKGKSFWMDCMKPIVLGKTVEGVTVGSDVVKSCRTDKIAEGKKELKEMEQANK